VKGKVLLLSERRIADLVAYCLGYEFEDVISSLTDSERIDVMNRPGLEFSRRAYKLARIASGSRSVARKLAPLPKAKTVLDRDYELFFPVFSHTQELYSLETVPNWRERCGKAACYIVEVWSDRLPGYLVELMSAFDHIFLGFHHAVDDVARMTGRPCTYLPYAVDVLRFAPNSLDAPRPINVCNIGRRSEVTHKALIEDSDRKHTFYYYDTVAASGTNLQDRTFRVDNAAEHRRMLATILKRTSFFIANRSYVNNPEFKASKDEVSARFYEGIAAGTILIGEPPRTDDFKKQFDWDDAMFHLPFDSPDVGRFLDDLGADEDRLRVARRRNVREAALRHDWLHRIQVVFDALGLRPTEQMSARAQRLSEIASAA